jgi:phosphoenolpyruvate synthase/pyruvate phosphate dikinase
LARPQRKAAARPAPRRAPRFIYAFGAGRKDGRAEMKALLGGKGANLAEMARLGLPVPPGFTISTDVCTHYYTHRRTYPPALRGQVRAALAWLERALGRRFGDPDNPLLVSVRSGARASMPGMMDTILNLGLNDRTVEGLIRQSGDARFAWRILSSSRCRRRSRRAASPSTPSSTPTRSAISSRSSRRSSRCARVSSSPRIQRSSSGERSAPSSARG